MESISVIRLLFLAWANLVTGSRETTINVVRVVIIPITTRSSIRVKPAGFLIKLLELIFYPPTISITSKSLSLSMKAEAVLIWY